MASSQPDHVQNAQAALVSSAVPETPSTFLFVNIVGATMTREQKRQSPLKNAGVLCEDPFDSLPVKAFPGMHELIRHYFNAYSNDLTLSDDGFVMNKPFTARQRSTIWSLVSSEEPSFLVFLTEMARFLDRDSGNWRTRHLALKDRALKSVRERLLLGIREPGSMSDAYLSSIAGMQSAATIFGDTKAAISHLVGMRQLVRARGGIETFQEMAARLIRWCEFYVCAALELLPTITQLPPVYSSSSSAVVDDDNNITPFPPAFRSFVTAMHARTLAHLPPHWCRPNSHPATAAAFPLTRILCALHLISTAMSDFWSPFVMAPGAARDAVACVLDNVEHALLVELAAAQTSLVAPAAVAAEPPHDEHEHEHEHDRWLRAVLLHAAHAYLWTLGGLPPSAQMDVLFLERLQRALRLGDGRKRVEKEEEEGAARGGADVDAPGGVRDGGALHAALARCDGAEGGVMWALAVGWFMAGRILAVARSRPDQVHIAARGEMLLMWFTDRIADALWEFGEGGAESAARAVDAFPGTDKLRRGWHALLASLVGAPEQVYPLE